MSENKKATPQDAPVAADVEGLLERSDTRMTSVPADVKNLTQDSGFIVDPGSDFVKNYNAQKVCEELTMEKLTGSIFDSRWCHIITRTSHGVEKPYLVAITLLSHFLNWHTTDKNGKKKFTGSAFNVTYSYLMEKYNFSRDQVRDAMDYLGKKDIIKRSKPLVMKKGAGYLTVVNYYLNVKVVKELLHGQTNCSHATDAFEGYDLHKVESASACITEDILEAGEGNPIVEIAPMGVEQQACVLVGIGPKGGGENTSTPVEFLPKGGGENTSTPVEFLPRGDGENTSIPVEIIPEGGGDSPLLSIKPTKNPLNNNCKKQSSKGEIDGLANENSLQELLDGGRQKIPEYFLEAGKDNMDKIIKALCEFDATMENGFRPTNSDQGISKEELEHEEELDNRRKKTYKLIVEGLVDMLCAPENMKLGGNVVSSKTIFNLVNHVLDITYASMFYGALDDWASRTMDRYLEYDKEKDIVYPVKYIKPVIYSCLVDYDKWLAEEELAL